MKLVSEICLEFTELPNVESVIEPKTTTEMPPKVNPRAEGTGESIAEIFPQRLVVESDKEGLESWSVSHRTISGSRSNRTKKSNVLSNRLREENDKFAEEQAVDSDDMDSLDEVIKVGVEYRKKNSQKIRDAIEVLVDVAKT